ncbi:YcnI family protein [Amycolatopsis sp.]|uniref:YcnI family copper-binding membrane protein n=1 Tax=Amycolatopsis sp. TaxID=37632 RepID=UPI002E042E9D|nr:YcnI family protein [Amycolatopsis sp.]
MSHNHFIKRAGFLSAAIGITGLLSAGVASAHVTADVYGAQPTKGGYGAIVLRVPNEDAAAGTIKVEVDVKPEYAISGARTKPVPGWTALVEKTKLDTPVKTAPGTEIKEVVSKISWTAQPGNKIAAGSAEFQEFEISLGALPSNVDELVLPAIQTYEGGKVVSWDQVQAAGAEEPEYPAPSVKLAAASTDDHHGAAAADTADTHTEAAASSSSDNTARWLGGAGLVVGALGLGVGAGATIRARKAGASATTKTEGTE